LELVENLRRIGLARRKLKGDGPAGRDELKGYWSCTKPQGEKKLLPRVARKLELLRQEYPKFGELCRKRFRLWMWFLWITKRGRWRIGRVRFPAPEYLTEKTGPTRVVHEMRALVVVPWEGAKRRLDLNGAGEDLPSPAASLPCGEVIGKLDFW